MATPDMNEDGTPNRDRAGVCAMRDRAIRPAQRGRSPGLLVFRVHGTFPQSARVGNRLPTNF